MTQAQKTKLILISAICIIVLLLIISVAQIVSINDKQRQLENQQIEIDRLNDELNYYENQNKANSSSEEDKDAYDDKNGDIEIIVGEE